MPTSKMFVSPLCCLNTLSFSFFNPFLLSDEFTFKTARLLQIKLFSLSLYPGHVSLLLLLLFERTQNYSMLPSCSRWHLFALEAPSWLMIIRLCVRVICCCCVRGLFFNFGYTGAICRQSIELVLKFLCRILWSHTERQTKAQQAGWVLAHAKGWQT